MCEPTLVCHKAFFFFFTNLLTSSMWERRKGEGSSSGLVKSGRIVLEERWRRKWPDHNDRKKEMKTTVLNVRDVLIHIELHYRTDCKVSTLLGNLGFLQLTFFWVEGISDTSSISYWFNGMIADSKKGSWIWR